MKVRRTLHTTSCLYLNGSAAALQILWKLFQFKFVKTWVPYSPFVRIMQFFSIP